MTENFIITQKKIICSNQAIKTKTNKKLNLSKFLNQSHLPGGLFLNYQTSKIMFFGYECGLIQLVPMSEPVGFYNSRIFYLLCRFLSILSHLGINVQKVTLINKKQYDLIFVYSLFQKENTIIIVLKPIPV